MLFLHVFNKLDIPTNLIQSYLESLLSFLKNKFTPMEILIYVMVRYLIVEADTSYNILIKQKSLNQHGAVESTPHMAMKFSAKAYSSIIIVKEDPKEAQTCYSLSLNVAPYVPHTNLTCTSTTPYGSPSVFQHIGVRIRILQLLQISRRLFKGLS